MVKNVRITIQTQVQILGFNRSLAIMDQQTLLSIAKHLDEALRAKKTLKKISDDYPQLSLADGYAIQRLGIKLRMARGERIVGYKLGLSSGVFGVLTDAMTVADNASIRKQNYVAPKIEPEIAFVLKQDLQGEVSLETAIAACSEVCPVLEILDSRYAHFKGDLVSALADDLSASGYVLGSKRFDPRTVDVADLAMTYIKNGERIAQVSTREISGHPGYSLVLLAKLLAERGEFIPAGSVVLCGSASEAIDFNPGDKISLRVEGLGEVNVEMALC